MRSFQLLLILAYLACCSVGFAAWITHGTVWSKDFGGKEAPNFKGQPKILVTVRADAFFDYCQLVKADVNGRYYTHCVPQIVPFSDPNKTVTVCHRLYGGCRCKTVKPVKSEWLDVELRPNDRVAKGHHCARITNIY